MPTELQDSQKLFLFKSKTFPTQFYISCTIFCHMTSDWKSKPITTGVMLQPQAIYNIFTGSHLTDIDFLLTNSYSLHQQFVKKKNVKQFVYLAFSITSVNKNLACRILPHIKHKPTNTKRTINRLDQFAKPLHIYMVAHSDNKIYYQKIET